MALAHYTAVCPIFTWQRPLSLCRTGEFQNLILAPPVGSRQVADALEIAPGAPSTASRHSEALESERVMRRMQERREWHRFE